MRAYGDTQIYEVSSGLHRQTICQERMMGRLDRAAPNAMAVLLA